MVNDRLAAFIPHALPPTAPLLELDETLLELLNRAERSLVRLESSLLAKTL